MKTISILILSLVVCNSGHALSIEKNLDLTRDVQEYSSSNSTPLGVAPPLGLKMQDAFNTLKTCGSNIGKEALFCIRAEKGLDLVEDESAETIKLLSYLTGSVLLLLGASLAKSQI